ncbi:MAG: hypothetical protein IJ210_15310 [Clostridia bacterium]|nr:hypothetical protein [Clostridia bacterium]
MKKIIKGKVYDTETAKKLGCYENMQDVRNFNHFEEELYRKKTGEFFLYGHGGPASKYSQRVEQNTWSGGEDIIPLDFDNARAWAEENLDADEYEYIFGAVSEDEEDRTIHFKLPADLDRKLTDMATECKTSKSDLLRQMVEKMVE